VQATLKPRRPGRRYQQHAGEGAWVNACADQMLDINERLISLLAGEVTPADSNETMPDGTLQLQAAGSTRTARCGGQIHRRAVECSRCNG
jgi:hypothetical protein